MPNPFSLDSLWLGLKVRISNPYNPDHGREGTVVTAPAGGSGYVFVRLLDGSHVSVGVNTLVVVKEESHG